MTVLSRQQGARIGLPAHPRAGQVVRDAQGNVWQWVDDEETGLGALGFWSAIVGGVTSLIGAVRGNKSKKEMQQAQQIIQEQDARIKQLEAEKAQRPKSLLPNVSKKDVMLIGFAFLGLMLFTGRKR